MNSKPYTFTAKDRKKGLKVRCSSNGDEAKRKGYNARARRIELDLSLKAVSELLGITTTSVVNKETKKQPFTVSEAIKLIVPYKIETLAEFKNIFQ